jgi:O-antigen/teichoic acid export membrane protein
MQIKNTLVKDGVWVASTQMLAALGTLAGVRLLTEFMTPADFGEMSLWLGAVALFTATLANPTMQALLRFYPEYAQSGQDNAARKVARHQIEKLLLWSLPLILMLVWLAFAKGWTSLTLLLLFALVLCVDIARMQNMAVLSASRNQKAYGMWLAAEAWLRPAFAVFAMYFWGVSLVSILAGYFVASLILWLAFRTIAPSAAANAEAADLESISKRFWHYSWPLLPLGLVGWLSGVGDRYIIGGILGIADVGLYAAVYGLASKPVLMIGAIVETTLRPVYQQAVVSGDEVLQKKCLQKWLGMLMLCSGIGLTLAFLMHEWLANTFLGPAFRSGSTLIPWLVLAHILLVLAQRNGRILYAHSKTSDLAKVETIPVIFALFFSWVLAGRFGLIGAVSAVIIGFGLQLLMSHAFSRKVGDSFNSEAVNS